MRLAQLFNPVRRLFTSLSVSTRIVVLALVPVAGFIANGVTYVSSEGDIASAFNSVKRSAALADASRDFKIAIDGMRIAVKDFSAKPSVELIDAFNTAHERANSSLDVIQKSIDGEAGKDIAVVRKRLADLKGNFDILVNEQHDLGFDDTEGLRGKLQTAGNQVEYIINENMSWIASADAKDLMVALLSMRHHEADYRLTARELTRQQFFKSYNQFTSIFDKIDGTDELKGRLENQVKAYADEFARWVERSDRAHPLRVVIDLDSQRMLPQADQVIEIANRSAQAASKVVTDSQSQTRASIIAVGVAMVMIGLWFSWIIGRGITRPLNLLAQAMKNLAAGDTAGRIPATHARDEIGDMARTVLVFRDSMIEREKLAAIQQDESRARETRGETIASTIGMFKNSVETALGKLRGAAEKLEESSTNLTNAADTVSAEAGSAEQRANAASENVTSAASSVEELAASINEIASQAAKSTEVSQRAVSEAQRTVTTMSQLGNAASRIGEVVGLIQAIAGQTNLLALNATIEAARAGESGKGFAVVASEVKSLAGQTAKATEEIASQVGAIQSAAADAAQALEQVNGIIQEMATIAATVAGTVDQQSAAVSSITEGVNRASNEARTGAEAMSRVAGVTSEARGTAADVKGLADGVAIEAENLEGEVRQFLTNVQAA